MLKKIGLFFSACFISLSAMANANTYSFEPTPCQTTFPVTNKIICGNVKAPLQYTANNKHFIDIEIAIIQSNTKNKMPLFYLEGGPGGNGLIPFNKAIFQEAKQRDLILIAPRGTGFSSKDSYACEGFSVFGSPTSDNMKKCRDSMFAQHVDFQAITANNGAEDIQTIATALHYTKIDLYGVSYGTYLALKVMKHHPNLVHSAVLDSTIPPQIFPLSQAGPGGLITIQNLLNDCAIDQECHARYPQLKNDFYYLLNKIAKQPIHLSFPYQGKMQETDVTMDSLLDSMSGEYDGIIYLPKAIHELATHSQINYTFKKFGNAITQVFKPVDLSPKQFSIATFWLTACQSLFIGENNAHIQLENQYLPPVLKDFYNHYGKAELANCHIWFPNHDEAPSSREPVQSDIPTLIFSGEYDGVLDATPGAWGKSTAASLTHSYFYILPKTGHVSLGAGKCPLKIMNTFLENPDKTPDASCIETMGKKRRFVTK